MMLEERITVTMAQLPPALQQEVLDFAEFLAQRNVREPRQIANDMPLAEVWEEDEADYEAEENALVAAGLLRLPSVAQLPEDFWDMPAPEVPLEKIRAALQADRDEE